MSKTLAELKADVLTIVKRPDLANDIELHTKNAILKAHSADYWKGDLLETAFTFAVSSVNYSLDKTSLIARWKKIKYLNTIDNNTLDIIRPLTPIDVMQFKDQYDYLKDYVFYEAGSNLQIRVGDGWKYFGLGVYIYPDTTLANPSWIADQFPFAIVYEAARTMFKTIGYDEQSTSMKELLAEAMAEVRMVGIPTIGE